MHLKKEILRIALVSVGITSIASLVYLGGPLIAIGGWHPLQSYLVREILIAVLIAAAASAGGLHLYPPRQKAEGPAPGGSGAAEAPHDAAGVHDNQQNTTPATK